MTPLPYTVALFAVPKAVPEIRRSLREWCGGEDSPDLLLCVSELMANVIVHLGEGTPVTLRVFGTRSGGMRVELSDPEPCAWPTLRAAADGEESGRGLTLVDAVAWRWGVERLPYGKTVWCELGAPVRWGLPKREPAGSDSRSAAAVAPGGG
ncbi:ATP-binding protein [Streptomyces sp. NBC_00654]|uniref:ATP-binding protein n=1 Tax=Streptomyces sp. NBC_00654 TaxID=2975799 RepID=UPI002253D433|nr:ATP-binding protein [Streptomyces sp. NBC_00654]MCX4964141.1 ATP-binding protein [Streptomyces sp. NBC_00654]